HGDWLDKACLEGVDGARPLQPSHFGRRASAGVYVSNLPLTEACNPELELETYDGVETDSLLSPSWELSILDPQAFCSPFFPLMLSTHIESQKLRQLLFVSS
ncbi:hypothetical protein HAX54_038129, partial [Datura stramonium]|nr:hypothetical protein [Datura stramonium]